MKLSAGKYKGLQAVSDSRGVIAALAIDQRGAMRSLFAKAKGIDAAAVPGELLTQYKEAVSRVLTSHASAILLDPEYGLPAAKSRAKNAGLLLAYEQTGYDKNVAGRLPRLLDHFSVRRLVEAGADCIKILLYHSPFSTPEVNDLKSAWVERIGAECQAADVPYFLELVGYADGLDEKSAEYAKVKPEVVTSGIQEFSKPRYAVDVLKVGVPVAMAYVEGVAGAHTEKIYTREEAKKHFKNASDAAKLPFIYLSEGVSNETFNDALQIAAEAGSNFCGVLCGRATWKNGVDVFVKQGMDGLNAWLADEGVRNIENVNRQLKAAKSWFAAYDAPATGAVSR